VKRIITTLFAAFALIVAADANAHLMVTKHCTTLQCINGRQLQNLKHARYVCNNGAHQNKRWNCAAVKWLTREYNETEAVLHPRVLIVGHYSGWSCITNGAYPKAPHEGNGYNGSHTGPLGMTTPWAGYMPPGRDWVHSPVSAVYAIAEKVAAQHHWNYTWMQGQWPQTFPPCAGHFN
jgi:hypothetical protein